MSVVRSASDRRGPSTGGIVHAWIWFSAGLRWVWSFVYVSNERDDCSPPGAWQERHVDAMSGATVVR